MIDIEMYRQYAMRVPNESFVIVGKDLLEICEKALETEKAWDEARELRTKLDRQRFQKDVLGYVAQQVDLRNAMAIHTHDSVTGEAVRYIPPVEMSLEEIDRCNFTAICFANMMHVLRDALLQRRIRELEALTWEQAGDKKILERTNRDLEWQLSTLKKEHGDFRRSVHDLLER